MPIQPDILFSYPPSVSLEHYTNDKFHFEYPKGAAVIVFDHGEGRVTYRLLLNLKGNEYEYDIEPLQPAREATSAESSAKEAFANAHRAFGEENVPAYRLPLKDCEAWRCKYRLVDGGTADWVLDCAFFQSASGPLWQLKLVTRVDRYENGRLGFESLLHSFKVKQ